MQYSMIELKKLQEVAAVESRLIDLQGYATRVFQEDNTVKGSWGYTVGLTAPSLFDRDNICLFVRAGIDDYLIDELLCEIADYALKEDLPINQPFTAGNFCINGSGEKLRLKIKKIGREWLDKLTDEYDTPIEGQPTDTEYYWIWLADVNNILPGEDGYVDFGQMEIPKDTVEEPLALPDFEEIED